MINTIKSFERQSRLKTSNKDLTYVCMKPYVCLFIDHGDFKTSMHAFI